VQATPRHLPVTPHLELAKAAGWALLAGIDGFERKIKYLF